MSVAPATFTARPVTRLTSFTSKSLHLLSFEAIGIIHILLLLLLVLPSLDARQHHEENFQVFELDPRILCLQRVNFVVSCFHFLVCGHILGVLFKNSKQLCSLMPHCYTIRDVRPFFHPVGHPVSQNARRQNNLRYGFEQQQRSERASRNRNRTAVCEYI